jgi:predicted TIM-barrel fold metal-dependent hydrolase
MATSEQLRHRLLDAMASVRTVDAHSHTKLRRHYYATTPRDFFSIAHYFAREVQGMTGLTQPEYLASATTADERWALFEPILARARNESYWRHHVVVYQDLFGLQGGEVTANNWEALDEQIQQATGDPAWYDRVTRQVCNLETQVRNIPWLESQEGNRPFPMRAEDLPSDPPWFADWEPEYFTGVLRMEPALSLHLSGPRRCLEQRVGRDIADLPGLERALADLVADYRRRGAVGIKLAHAYQRTLATEDVPESWADVAIRRAARGNDLAASDVRALQDYTIGYLAGLASDLGMVFQIHTGVQTNLGNIPESDPLLLLPLLRRYPRTRFDLFHAGYPYSREMGMLGKHYPNVWLNMAWMYVVTMAGSRQTLSEWIDLIPVDRILGFGSDVQWPELIYGHLVMARSCIADVLAAKVEQDYLSEESAFDLARMMLRDNGLALYGLGAGRA